MYWAIFDKSSETSHWECTIRLWLESVVRAISLQFGATYTDFQFVSKCNSSFCCWLYKVWDYHITYSFKNLSDHYNHHWKPCFRDPHCLRLGRWQLQTEPSHQNYETLSPVRLVCLLLFLSSVSGKDIFVWFVFFMWSLPLVQCVLILVFNGYCVPY